MTETQIRENVVSTAKKYLGCKESDGSHRKIIDIYNGHKPLARGYSVKYTDAWCATYVSAISILCGLTDIMPTECGCGAMIQLYQKLNRWVENDNYIPQIGDVVFYDWDDSGSGDNKGTSDHVGIVVEISGNVIKVIEGNKSDSVSYRNISIGGRYIRGYGVPDYAKKTTGKPSSIPINTTTNTATTAKIDTVKEVQQWANTNYKSGLVADGIYGVKTKKVLIKILQTELNQTYKSNLVVDGIWGAKTKSACPTLKNGSKNNVVGVLQALLICNGYSEAYLDKDYGSATVSAVKKYQKKTGLIVDGIAGKNTFAKLCM